MEVRDIIRKASDQPLTIQFFRSALKKYRNQNDKIHGLVSAGIIVPLRRGLYIAGPQIDGPRPEPALIANHLYGPSYVTADSALSFHGLIPEQVFATISATTRISTRYDTQTGLYLYHHLPTPYYSFGITSVAITERQHVLIASPQKALMDKIVLTSGLVIRSSKQARELLFENLRIDEVRISELDWAGTKTWITDAPKADSLNHIINTIETL